MKCGMFKGGLLGLGLASAALFWVFGGRAVDLVQSKAEKAREQVRRSITSFEDEIEMARKQVAKLDPAIASGAESLAKLEDSVKQISQEADRLQAQMAERGRRVERLRASLDEPAIQRVGTANVDLKPRVEASLAREIDQYNHLKRTLAYTQDTLGYRQALVRTAADRLAEMSAQRKTLLSKIDEIEARHKARVASQQFSEFRIDTSPLAEAEKLVSDLDRQESISARTNEIEVELSDHAQLPASPTDRDLRQEADEIIKGVSKQASYRTAERDA